ncbi:hypothetical protein ENUP19_0341G0048 [Entamoeba nuttalli]|uniref:Transporter, auxin efflux carrier (AEC) family protein n=2 Tax=Entamoeba nuttalli TaxID=412467 RepID=K2GYY8_ENTNP|nr:transporter, auxin efflux carrier (AEC) family protein [Entamoeba nuttalli P19]EKE39077.1 transporter, auxin efflux carrier (AEC) family protein [Entamoeba nuttalli P19]|eukprot:XP_008858588.1 transporter, auxin efflux carrier (AEC) family protein [Entamoeba nuttalli P19]
MTNSTWVIIRASLETVGKLVLVGLCGYVSAKRGFLTKPALAALSKVTFTFPMFCTIVTRLSSSVDNPKDILNWWPLLVSCFSLIAIAAFFMRGIAFVSNMSTKDSRVFVHTFSFGNPTVIALAIIDSLTTDTTLFGEGAAAQQAKKRGSAYISTHLFMFSLLFWILGYIYINLNKTNDEDTLPLVQPSEPSKEALNDHKNDDKPTEPIFEETPHWYDPISNSIKFVWNFIIKIWDIFTSFVSKQWNRLPKMVREIISKLFNPAFLAVFFGMLFLFVKPLYNFFFTGPLRIVGNTMKVLDQATVPLCLMIVGANMARGPVASGVSPWTIMSGIVMKYAILPFAFVSVIYLCYLYNVFIDDPVFVLIMCIESATPPVFNTIVLCTLAYPKGNKLVASLTFWGYLIDIITLTVVVAVSLLLIQDDLNVN